MAGSGDLGATPQQHQGIAHIGHPGHIGGEVRAVAKNVVVVKGASGARDNGNFCPVGASALAKHPVTSSQGNCGRGCGAGAGSGGDQVNAVVLWVGCRQRLTDGEASLGAVLVKADDEVGRGVVCAAETQVQLGG